MSPKLSSYISFFTLIVSVVVLVIVFQTQGTLSKYGAEAGQDPGLIRTKEACLKLGGEWFSDWEIQDDGQYDYTCEFGDGTVIEFDHMGQIQ